MATEGMIDKLIAPQVLDDFNDLMRKMDESVSVTLKWIKALEDVETKFSNITSFKDYMDLMSSMVRIEAELNKQHEKRAQYETDLQKIIERTVKVSESLLVIEKELKDVTQKLAELQEKQAEATKKMAEATEKQSKASKTLTNEQKVQNQLINETAKVQQNKIKANLKEEGSMAQLSLKLGTLKADYRELSAAQRESAEGKALLGQINEIDGNIKTLDASIGNFQRNVGNYQNAITGAIGANKGFAGSLVSMFVNQEKLGAIQDDTAKSMASASNGFQKAGIAAKGFGKQLLALLANPIVAIIAAIVAAFMALKKGISENEEASNRLKKAMAPLQVAFDLVKIAINALAEGILFVIELYGKLISGAMKLAEKLPIVGKKIQEINKAVEEKNDLVRHEIQLEQDRRKALIDNAKTDAQVAALRTRLAEKDYQNAEERIAILKEAIALEEAQNAERIRMAAEELRLFELREKAGADSAEELQRIAELQANLYKLEADGAAATLKFRKQLSDATQDNLREATAAAKMQVEITNVQRAAEAETLKKITADVKLSLEDRTKAYEDYVKVQSDILKATAGISIKEAEGDADKIKLIQVKLADDMRKLNEQAADFRMKEVEALNARILTAQRKVIDLQISDELDKIKKIADNDKGSFIDRFSASKEYYDGRINQLNESLSRELEAENLHIDEVKALESKTASDISKIREEAAAHQEKILIDSMTRQIEIRRNALQQDELSEIAALSEQYANGLLAREEYEKQKLEIQKRYAQQSREAEIQAILNSIEILNNTMANAKLEYPGIDTSEVEAQITSLQSRLMQLTIESNEATESMAEDHRNLWQRWSEDFASILGIEQEQLKEFASAISGTFGAVMDLIKIASDARLASYEQEMEALKKKQQAEQEALDNSIMSEERRMIEQKKLQIQQEAAIEEIEKKKKAEQIKQAKFEKKWALAQAIMNTAVGVMKAAPVIPLMVAIGIMGAAQAAVVAAQPIPAYAKGTDDKGHPETGYALVGDAYRSEAIITPSGKIYKSPNKPTVVNLQKGTIVKPDFNKFISEYANDVVNMSKEVNNYSRLEYEELVESNREQAIILREIAKKTGTKVSMSIDKHGFFNSMENESKRKKYLNYEIHADI